MNKNLQCFCRSKRIFSNDCHVSQYIFWYQFLSFGAFFFFFYSKDVLQGLMSKVNCTCVEINFSSE